MANVARIALASCLAAVGACQADPQYLEPAAPLEGGLVDPMTMEPVAASSTILLPIKLETAADRTIRDALAAELGTEVPYIRLDDLRISVEWTLTNPSDKPANAMVTLNGGNDRFYYDPSAIVSEEREAPPTPSLLGNTPITVPAKSTISGLFRDDQILEAAIDLELITRANQPPIRAVLVNNEDDESIQVMSIPDPMDPNSMSVPVGDPVPRVALAHMTRLDIGLNSGVPMTLKYVVRLQDDRGVLHKMLLGAPMDQLTVFMPAQYMPAGM
ncbi:MAG: hypothetical protein KBG15_07595 [Kofleriaceae bacterium]|nr:hypothetical protein [Kofleriaceae bacterium]